MSTLPVEETFITLPELLLTLLLFCGVACIIRGLKRSLPYSSHGR